MTIPHEWNKNKIFENRFSFPGDPPNAMAFWIVYHRLDKHVWNQHDTKILKYANKFKQILILKCCLTTCIMCAKQNEKLN